MSFKVIYGNMAAKVLNNSVVANDCEGKMWTNKQKI